MNNNAQQRIAKLYHAVLIRSLDDTPLPGESAYRKVLQVLARPWTWWSRGSGDAGYSSELGGDYFSFLALCGARMGDRTLMSEARYASC